MSRTGAMPVPTDAVRARLRCLSLTVHDSLELLVPNTLVAEVIDARETVPGDELPDWVLGMLSWRGRKLPLLAFERLLGEPPSAASQARRCVIINTLNGNPRLPYFALALTRIPHLSLIGEEDLTYEPDEEAVEPVLAVLRYQTRRVLVPDVDVIERMLQEAGIAV